MPPPVLCPAPRDLLNNLLDVAEVLRKGKKNEVCLHLFSSLLNPIKIANNFLP